MSYPNKDFLNSISPISKLEQMRVLVATNMYPTPRDPGSGAFVADQVKALRRLGHDVDVLLIDGPANRLNYLTGAFRLWRQACQRRYDLIHAHYVFTGLLALPLRWLCRIPLVVSFHGAGEMVGLVGQLCRWLAPRVDQVTVTSLEHYQQLGWPAAHIVPCGVDFELFQPRPQVEARTELGLPLDKKLVLYAGGLRPEKRIEIIQAAVALLQRDDPSVELILATGVPHPQVATYMNAADVLALASDYEGSPVVPKEAMACNLPIVSVAVADVPDLIGGIEGCYICQRTPEDMAAKLRLALDRGCRTDGRRAVAHLSVESLAERMAEIYKQAVETARYESSDETNCYHHSFRIPD